MEHIKDLEEKELKMDLIDLLEDKAIEIRYPMSLIWAHVAEIEQLVKSLVGKDKTEQRKGLEEITDKLLQGGKQNG